MSPRARYTGKELSKHLRELAIEAETVTDSGDVITKAEALARLIWKKALGGPALVQTPEGLKEVINLPESWAIQLIYDRLEGKVAQSLPEEVGKRSAAEKVGELARSRLNELVGVTAAPVKKTLPPKLPRKESNDRNA